MKITIDTKEDSREEIKRTIHFLSALLGDKVASNFSESDKNIFNEESSSGVDGGGNALTSLFGSDSSSETPTLQKEEEEKEDEDESKVQFIY